MKGLGVGLVPYSPLGRGFFTATINVNALEAGDIRSHNPRFAGGSAQANQPLLDVVQTIASEHQATPAQIALAWVMAQSDRLEIPVIPIPGTKHATWAEENAHVSQITLTNSNLSTLETLAENIIGTRY